MIKFTKENGYPVDVNIETEARFGGFLRTIVLMETGERMEEFYGNSNDTLRLANSFIAGFMRGVEYGKTRKGISHDAKDIC